MNNSQVIPMRKRIAFATAAVFAVALITSTFNVFILIPAAVVAQTQPINTTIPGY
jgi:hypothetical protein